MNETDPAHKITDRPARGAALFGARDAVGAAGVAMAVRAAAAHKTSHDNFSALTVWTRAAPAAWFALAEAKFRTSNITSQRVMFDLLVAALPEKHLSQVMDIIKAIPAINPYEVLKLRLLEVHMLYDQERWTRFSSWVP